MIDFVAARRMMVDGQVRINDVTDLRIQSAMLDVPREQFIPADKQGLAYLDLDVPVLGTARQSRRLLKPMVLAKLIQAAEIDAGDHVLDVACATGYSSAILARLARSVTALEEDAGLAGTARQVLAELGTTNVTVVSGPLTAGHPAQAPYDAILLNGATEITPQALLGQLKPGGRLVAVIGERPIGKATIFRRSMTQHLGSQVLFDAVAPLLPGFAKPAQFVF
jgi:protein-L-isoaspartate(D-aspartate) O-methyltransferase